MGFFTDKALEAVLPAAAELTAEQIHQVTEDAGHVYRHVAQKPGVPAAEVRKWGERQGIDPDRMNSALELLINAGKLHELPDDEFVAHAATSAADAENEPARQRTRAKPRSRSSASRAKGSKR